MITVRFAPSPTGYLHIGGARTALFNWMYARSQGGKFILRIEDTDLERSKKEFVNEILDSMSWLGMNWDGLYYQSERFEIYKEYAKKLLEAGLAYKEGEAVILKMPLEEIKLYDLIRGEITFDAELIKDQVLIKSDGSPTYSFACVIDDALMEVSCVIRGDDHISNTPKQLIMYKALNFKAPKFAHLPLIMGKDGGRLSKRTGAVAVSDYRKMGFLPEAVVNYLMLLGWSPGGNEEVVSMASALKKFSIKKLNKAAAIFDMEKLIWINSQYIKQTETSKLVELLLPFLKDRYKDKSDFDRKVLQDVVNLFKGRMPTLTGFIERTEFFFVDNLVIDEELKPELNNAAIKQPIKKLTERFKELKQFDVASTETAFRELVKELNLDSAILVHPVRVALTNSKVGPGLFETMALLGKEKTIKRLADTF